MSSLFDGAWLKWVWAGLHADELETHINRFAANTNRQPLFTFSTEYDAKRHGFPIVVDWVEPLTAQWGLRVGDIAHNYRSCLDHIAWALFKRGKTPNLPERRERKVAFPIADDKDDFNTKITYMLPGVTRTDIAIVRRHQPWRKGKRKTPTHSFTILQALNNEDKHRTIRPLPVTPVSGQYEVIESRDCLVTDQGVSRGRRVGVEVGAELGFIRARKTGPKPYLQVKAEFTGDPTVTERIWLKDWLAKTKFASHALLSELGTPPADLRHLLGTQP